jgi:hypothetical protein
MAAVYVDDAGSSPVVGTKIRCPWGRSVSSRHPFTVEVASSILVTGTKFVENVSSMFTSSGCKQAHR